MCDGPMMHLNRESVIIMKPIIGWISVTDDMIQIQNIVLETVEVKDYKKKLLFFCL